MRPRRLLPLFVLTVSGLAAAVVLAADQPAPARQHLLVTLVLEQGQLRLDAVQVVDQAMPKRRDQDRHRAFRVRLLDAKGRVAFQRGLADPRELRGEFEDRRDPSRIEGHHLLREGPVPFVVRLPVGSAGRLQVQALPRERAREVRPPEEAWRTLGAVELKREVRP